ncbi:MAG TPA: protein translocase subunit SecD [Capillimicrobium sp.]|nr:protein translocase subunit SecD [Capillimicrobium sp.]
MTDRRRNLFILLLVFGLLAASAAVIATKSTRLGLDLKGGVELIYEAQPTRSQPEVTPDALNRSIDIMRERVDQLGVAEPEIQRSGPNQIQVSLPDVKNAKRAEEQVGQVAQLYFYDWEPNVIGPDGKPAPQDQQVTGGSAAGDPTFGIPLYDAVRRAAKRPATNLDKATTEAQYYLLDTENQKVEAGPAPSRTELLDELEETQHRRDLQPAEKVYEVKPGTVIVRAQVPDDAETKPDRWYVLNDAPALKGDQIKDPEQNFDNGPGGTGQPIVTFGFTDEGRKIWQDVTREIAQRGQASQVPGQDPLQAAQHFAIVLDNELISVPYIDYIRNPDGIDASTGSQIEGGFTIESAQELTNLLKTGALPLKLELISQSQVSATLGQQALDEGLLAGVVGFIVVALFLLVFYRVLGLIAVGALVIYAVYFFALIKLIPITLTLPGIAGLILTLSVAADANIVIFERVKEEIRAGRSIPAGIAQGYKKGLGAIIDANVVTFMVAFILFILATAGVKGFAFTLGVGTLVSLFTAVLATQAVLGTMGSARVLQRRSALGAGEQRHRIRIDFMGLSRWFFAFSGVILLVCALAIGAKGLNFGIDFESGTRITTAVEQTASVDDVRQSIASLGFEGAEVQQVSNDELGDNAFQISGDIAPNDVPKVRSQLDQDFGGTPEFQNQSIGPTFGETVAESAIIAIIASLIVISVYIALRFEWKYAIPVLIALAHDLLITSGVYALTGREVTTSTVAALLTILGFSLYDTIIVFDRVRENVPRMPRAAFSQIVNRSMSEVVVRSLATSFCTLLPVLSLLLFGGETLKDFAFALLVGTASGTYSSIFIAGPVLTHWKEREPIYRTRATRIVDEYGRIPAYADEMAGHVEVEPAKRRSRRGSILAPDDPNAVSREEFDEMVRDIEPEVAQERQRSRTETLTEPKTETRPQAPPSRGPAADLSPDEVVMPKEKSRKSRNKRHGRPR